MQNQIPEHIIGQFMITAYLFSTELCDRMAATQLLQFASSSFMSDAHSACSMTISEGSLLAGLQSGLQLLRAEELCSLRAMDPVMFPDQALSACLKCHFRVPAFSSMSCAKLQSTNKAMEQQTCRRCRTCVSGRREPSVTQF